MPELCTRCQEHTGHRVLDEHGSAPICRLCLLLLIGDLTRAGIAVTVVADQPIDTHRADTRSTA